jgi:4-hydroxythreonine-4-phosphate dehydrogenase
MKPHLAITMGDPAGIGPEIIVKACAKLKDRLDRGDLRLLVIGSNSALLAARRSLGLEVELPEVDAEDGPWPALGCLQAGPETGPIAPGVLSAEGGRLAYLAIERGVRLAQAGRIQASSPPPSTRRR